MAHHDVGDGYPWGEVDPTAQRPALTHRLSSISDISTHDPLGSASHRGSTVSLPSPPEEVGYPSFQSTEQASTSYVGVLSPTDSIPSPAERHSQQSMALPPALRVGTSSKTNSSILRPFRKASVSYEPITAPSASAGRSWRHPSKRLGTKSKGSLLGGRHSSIPEDEIDMGLLGSAMSMGLSRHQNSAYRSLGDEDDGEDAAMISPHGSGTFDISSFTGPLSPRSEQQVRECNQQEASGILTGGLGAGLKPETTITEKDLYANAPQTPLSPVGPTRKATIRMPFRHPSLVRAPTIRELRDLGQHEANKRGEIIQVIMEEPIDVQKPIVEDDGSSPNVDLSSLQGGDPHSASTDIDVSDGFQSRKGTFASSKKVQIFYPQANWKPHSMRWPYLSTLILFSVALAAAQEYLYRRGPLYEYNSPTQLNTWEYFSFKYLPTVVAVTFGVLWQITDFEVKRLEPYYQLSKEGGALAAESINVDYITFFNFFRPVKALRLRHYAVAVSSIATLFAVSLVPTLQAASIELTPSREEREADPTGTKKLMINPVYSRLLTSILAIIAVLGCLLLYQLQRRRSGLVADVKGIAGVAAMANRSHILMDFKEMDTASPAKIHRHLKAHRYTLRNSSLAPEDNAPLSQEDKKKYDGQVKKNQNPHPLMLRLIAGVPFVVGMMLFMLLIPVVLFARKVNVVTDKAPWLVTALAVTIKLAWGTLETDVRMIEPFYILSTRHASPKVLTLDYTAMAFGWMPIRAFLNGHILVGLVGLGSVLAEVLTVCAASFGNVSGSDFAKKHSSKRSDSEELLAVFARKAGNKIDAGEETFASFWVSLILALATLTFLCCVATLVYMRRRHPFLPRQPGTIASILAFIHQSKMLYDFVGTEKMNNDEMVKRIGGTGKTYGLGWFLGRDGLIHCGIDEEELISDYKHGDDARKASMPWTTNWMEY